MQGQRFRDPHPNLAVSVEAESTPIAPVAAQADSLAKMSRARQIRQDVAYEMLRVDFEQAFATHNHYRDSERSLFKTSLSVMAFPVLVAGALLSAGLVGATSDLLGALATPVIWISMLLAGAINTILLRAFVVNDRVQTEAKYQINALRSLYLTSLEHKFPVGWAPHWGSTNAYLATKVKFKAAGLSSVVLAAINAFYLSFGLGALAYSLVSSWWVIASAVVIGLVHFLLQLEPTWTIIRRIVRR